MQREGPTTTRTCGCTWWTLTWCNKALITWIIVWELVYLMVCMCLRYTTEVCCWLMILWTNCNCGCRSPKFYLSQFPLKTSLEAICNSLLIRHSIMSGALIMLVEVEYQKPKQRMKKKLKGNIKMTILLMKGTDRHGINNISEKFYFLYLVLF